MAAPPSLAGGVQVTLAPPTAAVAVPIVGAPGAVLAGACGVTAADGLLTELPPMPLAVTLNVTGTPLVRPLTVVELSVEGTPTVFTKVVPANAWTVNELTEAPAGSVHETKAPPFSASALTPVGAAGALSGTSWNELHSLVTGSVPMQNRRFSMFHSVSVPSPLGNGGPAATEALSATVTLPSGFDVMVNPDTPATGSSEKTAVSQLVTAAVSLTVEPPSGSAVGAGQSPAAARFGDAPIRVLVGVTISRTFTRFPGSTRPANTACCRVIPAVPGPKLPDVALFSMRSVRPISVDGSAGSVRTVIATRRALSPSMMSSFSRPSSTSLPPPPNRMLPSAQTPGVPSRAAPGTPVS